MRREMASVGFLSGASGSPSYQASAKAVRPSVAVPTIHSWPPVDSRRHVQHLVDHELEVRVEAALVVADAVHVLAQRADGLLAGRPVVDVGRHRTRDGCASRGTRPGTSCPIAHDRSTQLVGQRTAIALRLVGALQEPDQLDVGELGGLLRDGRSGTTRRAWRSTCTIERCESTVRRAHPELEERLNGGARMVTTRVLPARLPAARSISRYLGRQPDISRIRTASQKRDWPGWGLIPRKRVAKKSMSHLERARSRAKSLSSRREGSRAASCDASARIRCP